MVDREKVLKGLEACADRTGALCRTCPYDYRKEGCISDMARDALELLKEQPKQGFFVDSDGKITPLPMQKHGRWIDRKFGEWKCSACNDSWYLEVGDPEDNEMNYCPICGAKMDEEVVNDASKNS